MSVTIHDADSGSVTIKLSDSGRISLSDITAATIGDLEPWTNPDSTTQTPDSPTDSQFEGSVLRPWEEKAESGKSESDPQQSQNQSTNSIDSTHETVQNSTETNSNNHIKRQLEDFYSLAEGPQWKRQKFRNGDGISLAGGHLNQNVFTNNASNIGYKQRNRDSTHNGIDNNSNQQHKQSNNVANSVTNGARDPLSIPRPEHAINSVRNGASDPFNIPKAAHATNSVRNGANDPQNCPQFCGSLVPFLTKKSQSITTIISEQHTIGESKVCGSYSYPSLSQLCDEMDSPSAQNPWCRSARSPSVSGSVPTFNTPLSAYSTPIHGLTHNTHLNTSRSVDNVPKSAKDNIVTPFNTPVPAYNVAKLASDKIMTPFNTPVSANNVPRLASDMIMTPFNTPMPANNMPKLASGMIMTPFNTPVLEYKTPTYSTRRPMDESTVSPYKQYSPTGHGNSPLGTISNFYKDHFKVKDVTPMFQRTHPEDNFNFKVKDTTSLFQRTHPEDNSKAGPVTPVGKRPPPLPSYSAYDSPGVESRFNESLSNLIGSPPPDSPLSKNPFFSDLQALLSTECKADLLPKTLFGIYDNVSSAPMEEENIFLRERKLHDRFNDLQASNPDEVRNLSSFFRYQTAMIETERFRTLHESQYPREHKASVNCFYDNKIHKVISRVEQSVILLENANREKEAKKLLTKPRPHLNRAAIQLMESWYVKNMEHPYPTNTTIEMLANNGNISTDQVKKWFANKRNRGQNTRTLTEIAMKKRKLGHLVGSN